MTRSSDDLVLLPGAILWCQGTGPESNLGGPHRLIVVVVVEGVVIFVPLCRFRAKNAKRHAVEVGELPKGVITERSVLLFNEAKAWPLASVQSRLAEGRIAHWGHAGDVVLGRLNAGLQEEQVSSKLPKPICKALLASGIIVPSRSPPRRPTC